jgi:hypothetical protein
VEEVPLNRPCTFAFIFSSIVSLGCDGGPDVATVVGEVQPPPVETAAPTVSPTAAPTASGVCANGNMPVARFDIKVFTVRDSKNELREFMSSRGPFFVGESLRFDSQGKDRFGQRTNGCTGEGPRWTWRPEEGLVQWNGLYGWMPSAKVLAAGTLTVTAEFEGGTLDFPLEIRLEE